VPPMRRILLICASLAVLTLPAASTASSARQTTGFLVVRKATNDGGAAGPPVATVVVRGFVLGRISQEGRVDVYHLATVVGRGAPQAAGADVSRSSVRWRRFPGTQYSGSDFRFSAIDGAYRVVVRGSGVYLFVGGHGSVTLRGSAIYPGRDGEYALDGKAFLSLPSQPVTQAIGGG
jgi:hypothetical protein